MVQITQSKSVRFNIGGEVFQRERFLINAIGWAEEEIVYVLRETALEVVDQQAKIDNLPSDIVVDGSSFKHIEQAKRRVVVSFGNRLAHAVITAIKQALKATINHTTNKITGKLENIDAWEWTYVPGKGRGSARVIDPYSIPTLAYSDRLIIRPKEPYASSVNMRVRSGSRSISFKTSKKASESKKRKVSNKGFIGAAAQLLKRNYRITSSFSIYAGFTRKFAIPGELWTAGKKAGPLTGQIILRPKRHGRVPK